MNLRRLAAELDGYVIQKIDSDWWVSRTRRSVRRGPFSTMQKALSLVPDYTGNEDEAVGLAARLGHRVKLFGWHDFNFDGEDISPFMARARAYEIVEMLVSKIESPPEAEEILQLPPLDAVEHIKKLDPDNDALTLYMIAERTVMPMVRCAASSRPI